jgi:CRISPR/Cas system-associated exonuclease Cas4 (RecB family)
MIKQILSNHFSEPREEKQRSGHYPSDSWKCKRELYYKWFGYPESNPMSERSHFKIMFGNLVHEKIQEIVSETMTVVTEQSMEYKPKELKIPIRGRFDIYLPDYQKVVEIKTAYGMGGRSLKEGPSDHHLFQVLSYFLFPNVTSVTLAYLLLDWGSCVEFEYSKEEPSIQVGMHRVLQKYIAIEEMISSCEMPGRDYYLAIRNGEPVKQYQKDKVVYKSDWQCRFCSYQSLCWNVKSTEEEE